MKAQSTKIYLGLAMSTLALTAWLAWTGDQFMVVERGMRPQPIPATWMLVVFSLTLPPAIVLRNLGGLLAMIAFANGAITTSMVLFQEPGQLSFQQMLIGLLICPLTVIAVSKMDIDVSQFDFSDLLR